MALDLHLAKNEEEVVEASVSFEMQPHELIFSRFGLPEGKYPLFKRMADYYKDTKYSYGEIQDLISEVEEIRALFSDNSQLLEQLDIILMACEKAYKNSLSIWVYCD